MEPTSSWLWEYLMTSPLIRSITFLALAVVLFLLILFPVDQKVLELVLALQVQVLAWCAGDQFDRWWDSDV